MLSIRAYEDSDRAAVLSFIGDESTFYNWSAGRLGAYPPDPSRFDELAGIMRFTASEDGVVVGFFTLREPEGTAGELRLGFVVVDPARRGRGLGREMLALGVRYAFAELGANRVSIGVFEDNLPAYRCYKSLGFRETGEREEYEINGKTRTCVILSLGREENALS